MKNLMLVFFAALALAACSEKKDSTAQAPAEKKVVADINAGKAVAEKDCKGCHGLDGRGAAPGIPHLAAQRERYLLASLQEYKEGKRTHAALKDLAKQMSDADTRNVAAYYASLPSVPSLSQADIKLSSPYEEGKALAAACTKCHGENGNSKTPGTPSLAGQQPVYLVTAIQEYHQGERAKAAMNTILRDARKIDLEKLALFYASQTPAERPAPPFGDPAAGEPLSAMCGGCHGSHGVSTDAATPTLAGQEPQYLINSIKGYRTTRQHWGMQRYVAGLSDKDVQNIVAFYVTQKSRPAHEVPQSVQELAQKCNRCHDADTNPTLAVPKLNGQDRAYLAMALRGYRDDKRESSPMHKMSFAYSNAIIESLSTWYATQPPSPK